MLRNILLKNLWEEFDILRLLFNAHKTKRCPLSVTKGIVDYSFLEQLYGYFTLQALWLGGHILPQKIIHPAAKGGVHLDFQQILPGVQGTGDCIAVRRADPYTAVRPVHSDDCTFLCRQGQHGGPCGLCFVQRKAECIPCPACKRDAARQTVQREQFFQRERGTIFGAASVGIGQRNSCLLYTSPSPRD